ncbi:MAG: phenylalanine--tRNA ligase subunit beta [Patescibacteria group bacterium]|jgi:phenylalanyl-tRNA synthetase beta chain
MQISYQWLREYVKLPDSLEPETIAEKLKLSTVEVEGLIRLGAQLENVVVGKVLKAEKHPDADKLKVCEVDLGDEKATLVCGGSNVKEGMLCAVAKIGAKVKWHGEGEPVTLEKASIRGVESSGMICGADEIGLLDMFPKKEEKEIVDLTALKLKVGKPLAEALKLNDVIFEIDNKSLSNRPDLWGHYGIAREVAALTNRSVQPPKVKDIKAGSKTISVKVENEKDCPRYMAVAVEGVKIGESPAWLKQKLSATGVRPINNVVDITNYVMLALGQPLHAFDGRTLQKDKGYNIGVRAAKIGEKFVTLDEKERDLPTGTLLITSLDRPVAIAGIMGGLHSGVKSDTETVIFEAANFSGPLIRKISTLLNLRTDASARFEKKLDPSLCETALKKAVEMLLELSPGAKVASKVADAGRNNKIMRPLEMPVDFVEKFSGIKIPAKTILTILERLGFEISLKGEIWHINVPSWRAEDVNSPEAVVEEVLRIYGYQNITGSLPTFTITPPLKNSLRSLERRIAEILVRDFAYTEVYNYSFVSAEQMNKIGEDISLALELDNPLSKEKPFLRRSLLPNLLEIFKKNADHEEIAVFEIGQVYQKELSGLRVSAGSNDLLPREDTYLTVIFSNRKNNQPFGEVKKIAIRIMNLLGVESQALPATPAFHIHPARAEEIKIGENSVGKYYELHPRVCKNFGVEGRVSVLTLNLSQLSDLVSPQIVGHYEPMSQYPEVERDLAFVVDKKITNQEVVEVLAGLDPVLKKIELFDSYEGEKLAVNKKSLAYHFTFSHQERTLTSDEVSVVEQKIKSVLTSRFQAELR